MNNEKFCMNCGTKHPIYAKFCMSCNNPFDGVIKANLNESSKYGNLTDSVEINNGTTIHRLKKPDIDENVSIGGGGGKIKIGDIAPDSDSIMKSYALKGKKKKAEEFVRNYKKEPSRRNSGFTTENVWGDFKERNRESKATPTTIVVAGDNPDE